MDLDGDGYDDCIVFQGGCYNQGATHLGSFATETLAFSHFLNTEHGGVYHHPAVWQSHQPQYVSLAGASNHTADGDIRCPDVIAPNSPILTGHAPVQLGNRDTRVFAAHVAGHGFFDVEGALAQIATRAGMIRIDTCRGNLPGGRETIRELADREPYSRPYDLVNKPPYGFLKGMSGLTEFVTQSWQLGRARGFLSTRLEYDREAMTFIEFSIVRWLFTETGDQSTLLLTVIHSLPVWNPQRGAWGYKVQPFIRHQDAASNVTCRMLQELRKAEPSKASRLLRECWQRRLTTIE